MSQIMEKIKRFIIKHDELFFILLFFAMILGKALYVKTVVGDEIWNFQNVYKMYNGYKLYVDANAIITPNFFFIGLLLFKILGANFFVFRIYNALICLFLYLGIYKIFKALSFDKKYSLFFTIIIFILENKTIITCLANYNSLVIVFVLYAVLILINREKYKHYSLYESFLIFLIFITKQNVGILYLTGYIIYIIVEHKVILKNEIKVFLKFIFFLLIFLILLLKLGILSGFINYCFLGIKEFTLNIFIEYKWVLFFIFTCLVNCLLIVFMKYNNNININSKNWENIKKLTCFSFVISFIAYPIFNSTHITYPLIFQYILLIYMLYIIFKNLNITIRLKKYIKTISMFLIFILGIESIIYTYKYFDVVLHSKYKYEDVYFGTLFSNETKNKIENVTKFIEESDKNVIIVSPDAALYMIPLKKNNGEMDLIMYGNLGKDGENRIINTISNFKNEIVLLNKEKISYQESDRLREYVINNFKNIGEIEGLLIFEAK